ncbi:DNA helicase RecQ [Frigidibacter sp. ROC022]|uniref:DNA helicase RecQ n=1 Tax=Frigidibacter sp. ROC022 TaxID=2971796 RepID=UPI00215AABAC|nr:DNA helicase RecQ [Frigidibacter sp. ROC022]MCR8724717.1 DNA helicase RecQ [Frigidibacter sp. ROC022]
MQDAGELLKSVFGFDAFRPGQAEIVEAVSQGRDVLAILPTGGGKSLCFQMPALMREGVTVVISPLIALMRDQVRALKAAGVEAGALTSGNTEEETDEVYRAANEGRLRLLYIAPERLASAGTFNFLRRIGTSLIAVDEAHCVSQWGHDFRPDYLKIGELRAALDLPVAAFTATADAETRDEIVARLFGGRTPEVFLRGFDRPNLALAFKVKDQPRQQILSFALARKGQSGIVYCGTRAKTESLAAALEGAGLTAAAYHAGLDAERRREVERRFQTEDGLIVVATVAFGMGVDKPDIRWVAQADLPKSIEAYYQEIGRAGRDGLPADTLTLYGPDDIRFRRQQIDEGLAPLDRKRADHARLNALLGLAEALGCRRQVLLGYFGENPEPCGNCDLCAKPPELFDATEPVRMALSACLRTEERFGVGHLVDVLVGRRTEKVTQWNHDALPTFGVGKARSTREWQAIFRQMMARDLVRPDPERHGALVMTEIARPVLRGEESVTFRKDALGRQKPDPVVRAMIDDEDAPLLAALKAKRRALAEAQGVPAYVVFTDRTLIEMAQKRPDSLDAMAGISGVGAAKLERYAGAFLEVILGEAPPAEHPARRKLAGRAEGQIYDRLLEAQVELMRGPDGLDKPLSCPGSLLRRLAEAGPEQMPRLLDERRMERFGPRFLEILREG